VIRLGSDGTQAGLQTARAGSHTALHRAEPVYGSAVTMRIRCAIALAGALGLVGCGEDEEHANRERPASSINVTAAISDGRIHVSPRRFGAGPIRLIVSNQTRAAQALTLETGGNESGVTQTTEPIRPSGTATLEVDVPEGEYELSSSDGGVEAAAIRVGAPRESAQNQLLLP
jgi:hypothetical protein